MKPRGPEHRRIWRPELAYAIGVLVTDGNLSPDGRHIRFVSHDVEHLELLARILGLSNRITRHPGGFPSGRVFRLTFGDRLFYDWMVSIGVCPRKTLTIGRVDVPDDLFPDFLRGHLDGDGSIVHYIDRYNTRVNPKYVYERLYLKFLSASGDHVEWLGHTVKRLFGVKGYINVEPPNPKLGGKASLHKLIFAKKGAIAVLRRMYYAPDMPCLARKRGVAEPFLALEREGTVSFGQQGLTGPDKGRKGQIRMSPPALHPDGTKGEVPELRGPGYV